MNKITLRNVINRKKFLQWLKTKRKTTIVGYPNNRETCPLSRYVKATYTLKRKQYVITNSDSVAIAKLNTNSSEQIIEKCSLPMWAQDFVSKVDRTWGPSINAEETIALFDKNPQQTTFKILL